MNTLQIQFKAFNKKSFYSSSHSNFNFIACNYPFKSSFILHSKAYRAPAISRPNTFREFSTSNTNPVMSRKTVLITGCSEGGIGEALAKEFHRNGLRVFATARNLAKVEPLRAIGLEIVRLDVVDSESIKQAVENVQKATGGTLDFLVNNSGQGTYVPGIPKGVRIMLIIRFAGYGLPLLDSDISQAKKLFDVNVFAVIEVTRAFAPLLISTKGTIVNIGSVTGKFPMLWQGYYNASKAAVNLLTDQLRLELSPFGVNAVNVITGGIRTKIFDNMPSAKLPEGSLYGPVQDIMDSASPSTIVEKDSIDVDDYARMVVTDLLRDNPKKNHWVGGSVWKVWLATFGWQTIWVSEISLR